MKELKVGERVNITLEIVESNSCDNCFFDNFGGFTKSAFTQVGHKYDEALDDFIFADGLPFGIKVEE